MSDKKLSRLLAGYNKKRDSRPCLVQRPTETLLLYPARILNSSFVFAPLLSSLNITLY
jgi:hypothetical protein